MAEPFLGELRLVSFVFTPRGWAQCNGQLLAISQNSALFALLGTQYGGNGQTSFALPDLRGRSAAHRGADLQQQGQSGGQAFVTLSLGQLPAHTHALNGTSDIANAQVPGGALPAARGRGGMARFGAAGSANTSMDTAAVSQVGSSQPHENRQPFTVLNYVIALEGIFPSRS